MVLDPVGALITQSTDELLKWIIGKLLHGE